MTGVNGGLEVVEVVVGEREVVVGVGLGGVELNGLAKEVDGLGIGLAVEGLGAGLGEGAGLRGIGWGVGFFQLGLELLEELFGFLAAGGGLGVELEKGGEVVLGGL